MLEYTNSFNWADDLLWCFPMFHPCNDFPCKATTHKHIRRSNRARQNIHEHTMTNLKASISLSYTDNIKSQHQTFVSVNGNIMRLLHPILGQTSKFESGYLRPVLICFSDPQGDSLSCWMEMGGSKSPNYPPGIPHITYSGLNGSVVSIHNMLICSSSTTNSDQST